MQNVHKDMHVNLALLSLSAVELLGNGFCTLPYFRTMANIIKGISLLMSLNGFKIVENV